MIATFFPRSIPQLSGICCYGRDVIGMPRADFLSSDCSQSHSAERTALIVIGVLFGFLVLAILAYAVDKYW